jgi:hypothetical protein
VAHLSGVVATLSLLPCVSGLLQCRGLGTGPVRGTAIALRCVGSGTTSGLTEKVPLSNFLSGATSFRARLLTVQAINSRLTCEHAEPNQPNQSNQSNESNRPKEPNTL